MLWVSRWVRECMGGWVGWVTRWEREWVAGRLGGWLSERECAPPGKAWGVAMGDYMGKGVVVVVGGG